MSKLPLTWWVRLKLRFCRTYVAVDEGQEFGDETAEIHFKKLGGRLYIVKIERYKGHPKHYNCRCITEPL